MDRLDKMVLDQWTACKTPLTFKFKDGKEKHGVIKGCYGLSMYVDFGIKDKTVVTFNILDLVGIVNIILHGSDDSFVLWAGDVNMDDSVNIQDIILVINTILEG